MKSSTLAILKALSDETRCAIVSKIRGHDEISCGQLSKKFDLSQPALSFHFRKLIDAGVIRARKEGTQYYYRINHTLLEKAGLSIEKLLSLSTLSFYYTLPQKIHSSRLVVFMFNHYTWV